MTPFVGTILAFGFSFPPKTWAQCNGQVLPLNQNQALFALLGTYYGGNGTTTFGLPDLRGRAAISQGPLLGIGNYPMGAKSGAETVTLTSVNLPVHTHTANIVAVPPSPLVITLNASTALGTGTTNPVGGLFASTRTAVGATYAPDGTTPVVALAGSSISITNGGGGLPAVVVGTAGTSTPVSIMQPYLAVNYCIALQGLFPSRN